MKILWRTNVILPEIATAANISGVGSTAGWIEGFLHGIRKNNDIQLGIICPSATYTEGIWEGVRYFLCSSDAYADVLNRFSPDVLHVFGTEDPNSNLLVRLFNNPSRTVINIQGMAGLYADVYVDGLPPKMQLRQRLFESYLRSGMLNSRDKMRAQSVSEGDMLQRAGHVIGRTDIDKMFAQRLNPDIHYHFCNEILRDSFYAAPKWDICAIKRHSIVIRNTGNPLKGFYQMLCAMPDILKRYPYAHLYVVGKSYTPAPSAKKRFTEGSYNKLCRQTAEKYNLQDHITALGALTQEEMVSLYLQTHVVASASVIENESNVVSEAKLLGAPVVASFVGGLPNRISHGHDGYLYPFNMPQLLAHYITQIFDDDALAVSLSKNAIATQTAINDPETNIRSLLAIYDKIHNNT